MLDLQIESSLAITISPGYIKQHYESQFLHL